jgi:hypothetical protein
VAELQVTLTALEPQLIVQGEQVKVAIEEVTREKAAAEEVKIVV